MILVHRGERADNYYNSEARVPFEDRRSEEARRISRYQVRMDQAVACSSSSVSIGAQKRHVAAGSGGDGPDRSSGAQSLEEDEAQWELCSAY